MHSLFSKYFDSWTSQCFKARISVNTINHNENERWKWKKRSHKYDINRPWSRYWHKYSKYKKCLSMIMLICIKQHLSNILSPIHEKVKKKRCLCKKACIWHKKSLWDLVSQHSIIWKKLAHLKNVAKMRPFLHWAPQDDKSLYKKICYMNPD